MTQRIMALIPISIATEMLLHFYLELNVPSEKRLTAFIVILVMLLSLDQYLEARTKE